MVGDKNLELVQKQDDGTSWCKAICGLCQWLKLKFGPVWTLLGGCHMCTHWQLLQLRGRLGFKANVYATLTHFFFFFFLDSISVHFGERCPM